MKRPARYKAPGERSREERAKEYDQRRGSAGERLYNWEWQKARAAFLVEHPLCCMCAADGEIRAATVVDHIKRHEGDYGLFWDRSNWQPLCKSHHDRDKQAAESKARRGAWGGGV